MLQDDTYHVSVNQFFELGFKMPEQNNPADLNELKIFYDPHPGLAGALCPIPFQVKKVAEGLNGKIMTLGEALAKIRAVTKGKV